MLPTLILPNLTHESVYQDLAFGNLRVIECAMQIGEAVIGFRERRGANELDVDYPLRSDLGFFFDVPKFARYVFTSGVLFDHPSLSKPQVKADAISRVIYEAFLMTVPFEPQDINGGADKHRSSRDGIKEGSRFACIYDQTYGSLRLTSRLVDAEILRKVLRLAIDVSESSELFGLNADSLIALKEIAEDSENDPQRSSTSAAIEVDSHYAVVIKSGSYGINTNKDNEEFWVEGIFFSPQIGELAYRGKNISEKKRAEQETWRSSETTVIVPAKYIRVLEGVSETSYYNYETGEIIDILPQEGEF
jgi:DEAD/DEAH box helicase domain-containing protein